LRILLVAIGRLKAGPERELVQRYMTRLGGVGKSVGISGVELREIDESPARRPEERRLAEAKAIGLAIPTSAARIVLDERGQAVTSADFAAGLAKARDRGIADLALVIGGPDGLAEAWRAPGVAVLSFGAMTLPHQLVRVLALEQVYRAVTLLAGHPYHRA